MRPPALAWRRINRHTRPVGGNHVALLEGGAAYFPALIEAFDAARHEIHLETYIFHVDGATRPVVEALIRAALRGVAVNLLIDGIGARDFPPEARDALIQAGVTLRVYRPPALIWPVHPPSLRRLHRKIAVIDARTAFVGGINLIADDAPHPHPEPRLDYAVRLQGPLVARIHANVRRLWRLVALTQLRRRPPAPPVAPSWPPGGTVRAAFLVRDNLAHRHDIARAYQAALALARHDILIANAYFLPGRRFRILLKKAAARGVRVRILVQGRTDHPFFQAAARALYGDLIEAGVQLHEHHRGELHAKVAVVDGRWATVGSSNIDPLSLLMAREANLVIQDRDFATTLARRLENALQRARPLDAAGWRARSPLARAASWLAYGAVRLIVAVLGGARWG